MQFVFEGQDCSGKGRLIDEVCKATNYKLVVVDRGHISNAVYSQKFSRGHSLDYYMDSLAKSARGTIIVYCYANAEIIYNRALEKQETQYGDLTNKDEAIQRIKIDRRAFDTTVASAANRLGVDLLYVDTTKDVSTCLADILNKADLRGCL